MDAAMPSDEVTDAIAHIEMHRQETVKEAGLATACEQALRKLHELLELERQAQPGSPHTGDPLNIAAVTKEIGRVQGLAAARNHAPGRGRARPGQPQNARRDGPPRPAHNEGRKNSRRRRGR